MWLEIWLISGFATRPLRPGFSMYPSRSRSTCNPSVSSDSVPKISDYDGNNSSALIAPRHVRHIRLSDVLCVEMAAQNSDSVRLHRLPQRVNHRITLHLFAFLVALYLLQRLSASQVYFQMPQQQLA